MDRRVEWTETAIREYRAVIFYYKNQAARMAAKRFESDVFRKIKQVTKNPESGRLSKKFKTVRLINVDKYRQMSYRVKGRVLYVTNFYDMRRDPNQRPF